jgi:hypothetical protein
MKSKKYLNNFILYINLFVFVIISTNSSFAQSTAQNFKQLANNLTNNVFSTAANLLIAGAFILFFWGVVVFIYGRVSGKGDMAQLDKGKKFMLWGLIAIFVMVSAYGIVKMSQELFNIQSTNIKIKTLDSVNNTDNSTNPPANPAQDIQAQGDTIFD